MGAKSNALSFEGLRQFFSISASSFGLALQELWKSRLRTFLSLFGITIGIFCIISVLATVSSLEQNLKAEIKSLGNNTIYVDKWEYGAGPDYPFWKYAQRPSPQWTEVEAIRKRSLMAGAVAFKISSGGWTVNGAAGSVDRVRMYGVSEDFSVIQPVAIQYGRQLTPVEFYRGTPTAVIGYNLASNLFGDATAAIGQAITLRGQKLVVAGVMRKQGTQLIGGWGFDDCVMMPYAFARTLVNEFKADPLILVQGREGVNSKVLKDELKGAMRAVHRLSPKQEDDFSLNDVNDFSEVMSDAFSNINLGGWIIGALSFVVGIFGVANIMFVTVRERRPQIGLQKALGARKSVILTGFLFESAFLCIIGGLIGLVLVFVLTQVATAALAFPISLPLPIIGIAIFICIAAGILAGIVPAIQAARLNPVEAIRS